MDEDGEGCIDYVHDNPETTACLLAISEEASAYEPTHELSFSLWDSRQKLILVKHSTTSPNSRRTSWTSADCAADVVTPRNRFSRTSRNSQRHFRFEHCDNIEEYIERYRRDHRAGPRFTTTPLDSPISPSVDPYLHKLRKLYCGSPLRDISEETPTTVPLTNPASVSASIVGLYSHANFTMPVLSELSSKGQVCLTPTQTSTPRRQRTMATALLRSSTELGANKKMLASHSFLNLTPSPVAMPIQILMDACSRARLRNDTCCNESSCYKSSTLCASDAPPRFNRSTSCMLGSMHYPRTAPLKACKHRLVSEGEGFLKGHTLVAHDKPQISKRGTPS
ncbi:hypothetical protein CAPTEDRAFT_190241 [Capitella teleta]|uniref:Uncharacterized protein n=1 Tax=Capitella teleta TaxID=283909 RepID=R7V558_CAPTE|nr:hypothetical protein CAPTEDRAFT_190241 [Capitella teleta]|eukprot:ELU13664.1 hypothetical protein CAPTEDRAFT_190241 [Capitella teleta]